MGLGCLFDVSQSYRLTNILVFEDLDVTAI